MRSTDQDAAGSRVSCVELGYLRDPYATLLATQPSTRRLPLLNRGRPSGHCLPIPRLICPGTYVRTSAIDLLLHKFLTTSPDALKQIISLGAGTDTRYFRLKDHYPDAQIIYHEIDFPSNTAAKLASIHRHPQLHAKLDQNVALGQSESSYYSKTYNVHALDLRALASTSDMPPPELPNLHPSTPTVLLSEMCLIYLQPSTVSAIIKSFLSTYLPAQTPVSLILYEPILPNDAFGRTMISNLATRNIYLPTLIAYPELGDQRARLKTYGFVDGYKAVDTEFVWRGWVREDEKERVAGLEMLDELEELELLLRHYCIAWGWRDGGEGVFSRAWGEVGEQEGV